MSFLHIQMVQLQNVGSPRGKSHPTLRVNSLQSGQLEIHTSHGQISLTPTASLCSQTVDLLSRPFREEKQDSSKKLSFFCSPLRQLGKSCFLQWIQAHVDIENELGESLAKEARTIEPVPLSTTVFDVNAVAKQKLCAKTRRKFSLPGLNYSREITTTIARLRIKHFKMA